MASLKEVKGRINSIHGTLKITSAMKMVASSKLHKAQEAMENMLPYERRLHRMLSNFLGAELSVESPFAVKREVKKVAVVVFASNSSLCGGFNANVIRHLNEVVAEYEPKVGRENILIYPVGRKVADAVKKMEGLTAAGDYQHMSGKPNYQEAADLAAELMTRFASGEIQQVELLYNHFKSTSSQVLTRETYGGGAAPVQSVTGCLCTSPLQQGFRRYQDRHRRLDPAPRTHARHHGKSLLRPDRLLRTTKLTYR